MKNLPRPARLAMTIGMLASTAALTGCIGGIGGLGGCGVGATPTDGDAGTAASVSATGVVTFQAIQPGTSEDFEVTVRDFADTDETILGATLVGAGSGAFAVHARFPLSVPAGQGVPIDVEFAPASAGTFDAQLVLQTAKMGPSPVPLSGSTVDADAGTGAD
jgi:hypothetical protein